MERVRSEERVTNVRHPYCRDVDISHGKNKVFSYGRGELGWLPWASLVSLNKEYFNEAIELVFCVDTRILLIVQTYNDDDS